VPAGRVSARARALRATRDLPDAPQCPPSGGRHSEEVDDRLAGAEVPVDRADKALRGILHAARPRVAAACDRVVYDLAAGTFACALAVESSLLSRSGTARVMKGR